MDVFKRSMRKKKELTPESSKPYLWQEDEKRVREATCSFQVKYHGCIEVFESRGIQVCEDAVNILKNIRTKQQQRAVLYVSGDALRVVDELSKGLIVDQTIEKVSFCAPDRNNDKGFAYICRDGTTRRWMCHVFMAVKESGERLSHAVGCAFTICLEKKQQREKDKVSITITDNGSVFTRTGSFRPATLSERLTDPQSTIVAVPVPVKKSENPFAVQRPHATTDMLYRQGSFRGFAPPLSNGTPFKRQMSLCLGQLPSTLCRQRDGTFEEFDGEVSTENKAFDTTRTTISPIVESSPVHEMPDCISKICRGFITHAFPVPYSTPAVTSIHDQQGGTVVNSTSSVVRHQPVGVGPITSSYCGVISELPKSNIPPANRSQSADPWLVSSPPIRQINPWTTSDVAKNPNTYQNDAVVTGASSNPWVAAECVGTSSNNSTSLDGNNEPHGPSETFLRRNSEGGSMQSDAELWLNSLTNSLMNVGGTVSATVSAENGYSGTNDHAGYPNATVHSTVSQNAFENSPANAYFSNACPSNGLPTTTNPIVSYHQSNGNLNNETSAQKYTSNGFLGNGSILNHSATSDDYSVGVSSAVSSAVVSRPSHEGNDIYRSGDCQSSPFSSVHLSFNSPAHLPYNSPAQSYFSNAYSNPPSSAPIYQPPSSVSDVHPTSQTMTRAPETFVGNPQFSSTGNFAYSVVTSAGNSSVPFDYQVTSGYGQYHQGCAAATVQNTSGEYYPGYTALQNASRFSSGNDRIGGTQLGDRVDAAVMRQWNNGDAARGEITSGRRNNGVFTTEDGRMFRGKETNPFTGMVDSIGSKAFELTL